jgi:glycosyltransferase involved in cell wall biosynthesis
MGWDEVRVVMSAIRVRPLHKYGGAEVYIYNLAKYLSKNGVDVKIIASMPEKGFWKTRDSIYDGLHYEFLPPYIPIYSNASIFFYHIFNFNLARKLRNENFDVLHSFGMTAYRYLKGKMKGKVIVEPFGLYGTEERRTNWFKKKAREFLIENPLGYCVKHANAVAVEGEVQARDISNKYGIPKDKFIYIPDGVEIDVIDEYLSWNKLTREEMNLSDADIVLVNVNRLVKNKGVNYLIDALGILNSELNAKLILIGSGPEEGNLKRKIGELKLKDKVIHFKDISDETKFQLIALADISVTPTLFEGLPIVILEAMACGKPVVASNVTEVPQVVKHGVNGFLVPPRDPEAIVKAVLEIYDKGLIKVMGRESRRIAEDYDWRKVARKTIQGYEKVINF